MNPRTSKWIWGLILVSGVIASGASIGYSAWKMAGITEEGTQAEEALYQIQFHGASFSSISGLELTSGLDLPTPSISQEDLASGRYYFAGWKIGTSEAAQTGESLLFSGSVIFKDIIDEYASRPEDKTVHLWAQWGGVVKDSDVLFDVIYVDGSSKRYKTLVQVSDKFYLYNINVPLTGTRYVVSFTYFRSGNPVVYSVNDSLDLTDATAFAELGNGGTRIITLNATLNS